MSQDTTTRAYVSAGRLERIREHLSARDLRIIEQVADLRLMSGGQIRTLHFPVEAHMNELAAARACHRVLARLTRERLLMRLARRIGGVRAGSAAFLYALGSVGQRLLRLGGARRRFHEPTSRFVDHTLAVTQLVVDVTLAARQGQCDIIDRQAEPASWRTFSGYGGRMVLRPDLYLALGVGEYEYRWFVEMDRGSETLPTLLRKCRQYGRYYQSGREQATNGGTFPRVCWIMPDQRRAERLRTAIERERQLPERLFVVTTSECALAKLTAQELHG
jgi:hypothetical protein